MFGAQQLEPGKIIFFFLLMENKVTTSLEDFQVLSKLGDGSFAEVFKVKRKQDGQIYAMKKIRMTRIKDKDRDNALNQVRILASQTGDHIVEFKEAFYDHSAATLYIIMQFASKGDLLKLIHTHTRKNSKVQQSEIWKALVHIGRALRTLHDKNILHRDLKGANIFITEDGRYKLGDLNVSKVIKDELAKTQTGTPYYASPEVWKDQPYGTKSDMWSLGCVIYEMAAGRPPFTATDIQTLYKRVMGGYYPRIPSQYSNDLAETISSLLKLDPKDRPSARQLLCSANITRHFQQHSSEEVIWENDELLSTMRFPSKNYKQINQILPPAQYERKERKNQPKEDTIIGSFFKNNQWQPSSPIPNQTLVTLSKERVKSTQGNDQILVHSRVRQRGVSNYEPFNKQQSSISDIKIFRQIPQSHKVSKKEVQAFKISRTPSQSKPLSKIGEGAVKTSSRRKVQSVVNRILSTETSRARNKENLRRIGENIVSGLANRKRFCSFK